MFRNSPFDIAYEKIRQADDSKDAKQLNNACMSITDPNLLIDIANYVIGGDRAPRVLPVLINNPAFNANVLNGALLEALGILRINSIKLLLTHPHLNLSILEESIKAFPITARAFIDGRKAAEENEWATRDSRSAQSLEVDMKVISELLSTRQQEMMNAMPALAMR